MDLTLSQDSLKRFYLFLSDLFWQLDTGEGAAFWTKV